MLDVGSGSGAHAATLAAAGIPVVAVDRDRVLASAARARGVPAVVADATALPFRSGSAGGGTCLEVLEHVEQPADVLDELRNALGPNAPLVVAVPTSYTERYLWRVHPGYARNATHLRIFSRQAIVAALAGARWRVEEIETRNLSAAIAWMFHGLLRTPADHTGAVQRLAWIERAIGAGLAALCTLPGGHRVVTFVERHVGKSWYIRAR